MSLAPTISHNMCSFMSMAQTINLILQPKCQWLRQNNLIYLAFYHLLRQIKPNMYRIVLMAHTK